MFVSSAFVHVILVVHVGLFLTPVLIVIHSAVLIVIHSATHSCFLTFLHADIHVGTHPHAFDMHSTTHPRIPCIPCIPCISCIPCIPDLDHVRPLRRLRVLVGRVLVRRLDIVRLNILLVSALPAVMPSLAASLCDTWPDKSTTCINHVATHTITQSHNHTTAQPHNHTNT